MWLRLTALTVSMLMLGAGVSAAPASPSPSDDEALIKPVPDAKLVGTATIEEIRAFPEMGLKGKLKDKPQAAKVVGVEGVDRVFETDRTFADAVSHFDQQFKHSGFQVLARVETPSATAWSVKRPDATMANLVVRNTRPTTFEIAEVTAASVKVKPEL